MDMRATSWVKRAHAAAIAFLLIAAVVALAVVDATSDPMGAGAGVGSGRASGSPTDPAPASALPPALDGTVAAGPAQLLTTDESTVAVAGASAASASASSAGSSFAQKYPAQAGASYDPSNPASNYWALLIGINTYKGSWRDNVGSYQDARDLRKHLLALGWRSDHITLIGNKDATASRIIQGIRWLASKTNSSSVVVFHYAGHEKPLRTKSDGDNEKRDVAIVSTEGKLITDGRLGKEMNKVRAARMWIDLAVCRAGGFNDAGMVKTGRVLTFSSPESELSYEDPGVHHSVFGWYLIMEGLRQGLGDQNGDGVVTVEEAYKYARPYVIKRTGGRQHPKITDKLSGQFALRVPPPPPPPPPPPSSGGSGGGCSLIVFCTPPKD
ncbi:MAG TPA: caspase family protein [Actinomycetota bacterium]|nr:caspase family protein [Actinomycetota bacterium]